MLKMLKHNIIMARERLRLKPAADEGFKAFDSCLAISHEGDRLGAMDPREGDRRGTCSVRSLRPEGERQGTEDVTLGVLRTMILGLSVRGGDVDSQEHMGSYSNESKKGGSVDNEEDVRSTGFRVLSSPRRDERKKSERDINELYNDSEHPKIALIKL
jgi:hypothetical protein